MTEERVSAPHIPTREVKLCWAQSQHLRLLYYTLASVKPALDAATRGEKNKEWDRALRGWRGIEWEGTKEQDSFGLPSFPSALTVA